MGGHPDSFHRDQGQNDQKAKEGNMPMPGSALLPPGKIIQFSLLVYMPADQCLLQPIVLLMDRVTSVRFKYKLCTISPIHKYT